VGVALRDESRGQLEMDTAAKSIAGLAAWHDVTNGEPIAIHCALSLSRGKRSLPSAATRTNAGFPEI
jgi:hypothetical protein